MSEYRELFAIVISGFMGFYANRLTGKKDSRSGEQALIDKLFAEIKRIDNDNVLVRTRLDKLETENGTLKVENYELRKENSVLTIENASLKTEILTFRKGV